MRLKLDENIHLGAKPALATLGHDVDTVSDEGLTGQDDATVWAGAQREKRLLVTQDLDFSDLRKFTPGLHFGVMLIRLPDLEQPRIVSHLERWFRENDVETWQRCFVVATMTKVRVIRPADTMG